MNIARYDHSATLLPNGKVLVAGGETNDVSLSGAELYDPVTGTWTPTGSMANARLGHTATLLPNGQVLVAGGQYHWDSLASASAELYDSTTGTWKPTGSMTDSRVFHTATLLPNGQVLVAEGTYGADSSAELYDPATGTWTATGSLTTARYWHTATLLPNGQVLLAGGMVPYNAGGSGSVVSSAALYDPASGTWTETGSLTTERVWHTATLLPNGQVLVAGGYTRYPEPFSSELYDPAAGTWTEWTDTPSVAKPRSHTATLLPNGQVLVAGGFADPFGPVFSSAKLYDPATGTWRATGSLTTNRQNHTATLLPNGQVLVAGGSGSVGALSSAELYDFGLLPTVITLASAANMPGGAFQFAFTNIVGARFSVLATTNLSLALSNWTVLGPPNESPAGHFQFSDPQVTNNVQRFYRVRSP